MLTVFRRQGEGFASEEIGPCRFVPLLGEEGFARAARRLRWPSAAAGVGSTLSLTHVVVAPPPQTIDLSRLPSTASMKSLPPLPMKVSAPRWPRKLFSPLSPISTSGPSEPSRLSLSAPTWSGLPQPAGPPVPPSSTVSAGVRAPVGDGVVAGAAVVGVALADRDRGDQQVVARAAGELVGARVGVEDVAAGVADQRVVAVVGAVVVLAGLEHVVAGAAAERVGAGVAVRPDLDPGRDARGRCAMLSLPPPPVITTRLVGGRGRAGDARCRSPCAAVAGEDRAVVGHRPGRRRRRRGCRRGRRRPGRSGSSRRGPG